MTETSNLAAVVVINVDISERIFTTFARHDALDLLRVVPPVRMWTRSDESLSGDSGLVDRALGLWPRRLLDRASLADALKDEVAASLQGGFRIGVVLVASSASMLVRAIDGSEETALLSGIASLVAADRQWLTRIWCVGTVLTGPFERPVPLAGVLKPRDDPDPYRLTSLQQLDSLVYLAPGRAAHGPALSGDQPAALRLVLDAVRGGEEVWRALRPEPGGSQPGIWWLKLSQRQQLPRPKMLRAAITGVIEELRREARDLAAEDGPALTEKVGQLITGIASVASTRVESRVLAPEWAMLVPPTAALATPTLASLAAVAQRFGGALREHYGAELRQALDNQKNVDRAQRDSRREIEDAKFPILDRGLSPTGRLTVGNEIDRVKEERDRLRDDAARARKEAGQSGKLEQARVDPRAEGEVALEVFPTWRDFEASLAELASRARCLPPGPGAWIWCLVPVLLFVLVAMPDLLSGGATFVLAGSSGLLIIPGALLLLGGSLSYWMSHARMRRAYAVAAGVARNAGDKVAGSISAAVEAAGRRRAAATAAQLADLLVARLEQLRDPDSSRAFGAAYAEVRTEGTPAAASAHGALRAAVADSLDGWLVAMIRAWLGTNPPAAQASLKVWDEASAYGLAIDEGARREQPILFATSWSEQDLSAIAIPLLPP